MYSANYTYTPKQSKAFAIQFALPIGVDARQNPPLGFGCQNVPVHQFLVVVEWHAEELACGVSRIAPAGGSDSLRRPWQLG
jgi:hypothetical protein